MLGGGVVRFRVLTRQGGCGLYVIATVSPQDCRWYHWLLVSAYIPHCVCRITL